jgi:hypothetical protein
MKSFREFITEKKKDLPGGNPSNISPGDIDAIQRQSVTGKREPLSTDITQSGRRIKKRGGQSRVIPTPEGPLLTNMPRGKTSPEEIVSRLTDKPTPDDKLRQQVRDTVAKNPTASPELQRAQSSGPPEEMVGSSKKPRTKPGSYVVQPKARRAQRAPGASGAKPTGSLSKGTLKFPGDAKYKEMLGDLPKAPTTLQRTSRPRIGTSGRATTQTYDVNPFSSKEFKASRYGRGKSGPSSPLRTPSQVTKFQRGVEKGYFSKTTGKLTSAGIQRYTDSRAAAGPNFGKGDPRAALSKVQDVVRRAASGDKGARAEVRRTYKAATTGYKPPQGTPSAPSKPTKPPSQVIAQTQQTGRIEASKPAPQPAAAPRGSGSSSPSKGGGTLTVERPKTSLSGPLKPGPVPTKPKAPVDFNQLMKQTKINTPIKDPRGISAAKQSSTTKPAAPAAPAAPAKSKPAKVLAPKAQRPSTKSVAPRGASNAAAASAKSFRTMARVGGLFATGLTVKNVRDQALASGAGRRRADLEGLAAGLGGSLASTAAITAATPTGPVGQAVAGTAAFQPGADFARGIVRKLAGKPGDAVTKKSVLKNIKSTYREVVPKDIRQKVPSVAKKGFTDFYNKAVPFANKLYKGYRRFERVSDLTGGEKK